MTAFQGRQSFAGAFATQRSSRFHLDGVGEEAILIVCKVFGSDPSSGRPRSTVRSSGADKAQPTNECDLGQRVERTKQTLVEFVKCFFAIAGMRRDGAGISNPESFIL